MRNAGAVARRVQAGDGALATLVGPDAGGAVAAAEADLRDVHLDHGLAVVGAAPFVEAATAGPLVGVQDVLDLADGFFRQVIQLQEHRALAAFEFVEELHHHLAAPVVALDEALARVVRGVAAERAGHVGTGRAVVVLDQRVDLEALEVGEFGARVVGHHMAFAGVGRVLVGTEHVAGSRQPQAARGTGADHHGLGLDDVEVGGAAVKAHHARDLTTGASEQPGGHHAVGDLHARLLQLAVQHALHVVAFGHGQHIAADVVHLAHGVVAGLVLLELDAPFVQLFDHGEAVGGVGVHTLLVHDAIVGHRDFLGVLLRRGVAGDHRVVQAIHAHGDRAAAFHVGLVQQQDTQLGIFFLGFHRGHGAAGAATDHHNVVLKFDGFHTDLSGSSRGGG